jgi:thiosulfate/3-mercaptopyruvate sulfurtransferase
MVIPSPIVSSEWLAAHRGEREPVVADVRWGHGVPSAGRDAYEAGHIPGAVFLDLDDDLSDRSDLSRGRHPLPDPSVFVNTLARAGIGQDTRVICYDDGDGSYAARLWWMMRWIGGQDSALLDGGLAKWTAEGREIEVGGGVRRARSDLPLMPQANAGLVAKIDAVERVVQDGVILLDARAPERYRGEVEPIDARAGHIPGAINAPFMSNLTSDQPPVFRSDESLKARFKELGIENESDVICYCGSGVTACHAIIALELAGVRRVRLYPGSWSEWIVKH